MNVNGLLHAFWQREFSVSFAEATKERVEMPGNVDSINNSNDITRRSLPAVSGGRNRSNAVTEEFAGRVLRLAPATPPGKPIETGLLVGGSVRVFRESVTVNPSPARPGIVSNQTVVEKDRLSDMMPVMSGARDSAKGDGSTTVAYYGRSSLKSLEVNIPDKEAIDEYKREQNVDKSKIKAKLNVDQWQRYVAGDDTVLHQRGGVRSWVNDKLSSLFSDVEKFPEFLATGMRSSLQHLGKGWDKHFGEPVFIKCGDTEVYQETYRVFGSKTKLFGDHKHINEMDDNEKMQIGIPTGVNFSEIAVNEKTGFTRSINNFKPDFLDESDVWIIGWVEETGGWAR